MKRIVFCSQVIIAIIYACNRPSNSLLKLPLGINALPAKDSLPISKQGIALGRFLFYDPILSSDSSISCASCHQLNKYLSDAGQQFSKGVNGQLSKRNTMALSNLNFGHRFNWDGGGIDLESQALAPITNPLEMNSELIMVIQKLNKNNRYRKLFKNVFNKDTINTKQLISALAMYERTFLSGNTKYDKYINKQIAFTINEQNGFFVFTNKNKGNCAACHSLAQQMFSDFSFRNNGLDAQPSDSAYYLISRDIKDLGAFKVPSLRNVAATAPYMHDGRFKTLAQVVAHYNTNFKKGKYTDTIIKQMPLNRLSKQEELDLVTFLNTLTDVDFINRKDLANPYTN